MQQESVDGMLRNGNFDPTVQSWHSKIDMPTPNPYVLYCIREIKNFPELGYCYVTVLVDRAGDVGLSRLTHLSPVRYNRSYEAIRRGKDVALR